MLGEYPELAVELLHQTITVLSAPRASTFMFLQYTWPNIVAPVDELEQDSAHVGDGAVGAVSTHA